MTFHEILDNETTYEVYLMETRKNKGDKEKIISTLSDESKKKDVFQEKTSFFSWNTSSGCDIQNYK